MSSSRVSFIPSTILTTSSAALAGTNGAVTFLNVPRDGQPATLSSTGSFKMALPRSSTSGQGSSLQSVNINYSIEDSNVNSVVVSLSTQSFGPGSVVTAIATTPSGFTLTPGNYTGVLTIDTPSYANGADPEYYLLDVTVTVGTSVVTELRINDVELVYVENAGSSFPSDVNIPGYLNVGSTGPPANTTVGDLTSVRLSVGTPQYLLGTPNRIGAVTESGQIANIVHSYGPLSATNSLNSTVFGTLINPSANSSATLAAVRVLCNVVPTDPTVNITGSIVGMVSQVICETQGGTYANLTGLNASTRVVTVGPSTLSAAIAVRATGFLTDSASAFVGAVTSANGLFVQALNCAQTTACNINTANGISIIAAVISGTTTVTTHNGIFIAAQTILATDSTGIRIDGISGATNNRAIWIRNNTAGTGAGICFGTTGDTSLYRGTTNQLLTPGDWASRHYLCTSTPTIAAGAGAGTSPTIAITGTDHGFVVTLTTGTACSTSAIIFTVTFGATWTGSAPTITYSPANAITASIFGTADKTPYIANTSTTSTTLVANSVALSDSTLHIWNFTVMR